MKDTMSVYFMTPLWETTLSGQFKVKGLPWRVPNGERILSPYGAHSGGGRSVFSLSHRSFSLSLPFCLKIDKHVSLGEIYKKMKVFSHNKR